MLAREYVDPGRTDGFTTLATPDLLIVINLSGDFEIESRQARGWSSAAYRPGSVGVTAPDRTTTLRWRHQESPPRRSLHLHLSASLLQSTAHALGDQRLVSDLPDALLLDDPVVLAIGRALREALEQRSESLHADSLAQALALHILHGAGPAAAAGPKRDATIGMAADVLPRVREYMQEHLTEEIRLDDLSREVSVSKFHLLRTFSRETGETPHRYLVGLRMQRAAKMLRDTNVAVHRVASDCGYRSSGQFGRAFRRHFGVAPSEYRRAV